METAQEAICCPVFEPALWDGKTTVFEEKLFVKQVTPQLFHFPLPGSIGRMMTRTWAALEAAQARPADGEFLWLSCDPSPWKCEHYLAATREVPGLENVKLSGTFLTKVFDGPFNHVPRWIKAMDAYLAEQGKTAKKYYFYYTTCPKCAKKYGHNYVVVFAEV